MKKENIPCGFGAPFAQTLFTKISYFLFVFFHLLSHQFSRLKSHLICQRMSNLLGTAIVPAVKVFLDLLSSKDILLNGCHIKNKNPMFSLFQFLNLQLAPIVSHLSIPACTLTASSWCSYKDPLAASDGFIYLCPFNYHNWAPLACTAFTYAWKWLMETVGSMFLVKLWWDNDYMLVHLLDRINLLRVTVSVVPHADFMPCWWIISCAFYFFFSSHGFSCYGDESRGAVESQGKESVSAKLNKSVWE